MVAWIAGRNRRTRDNLEAMQTTLDNFIAENAELYEEIIKLRNENAMLRTSIADLESQLKRIKMSINEELQD